MTVNLCKSFSIAALFNLFSLLFLALAPFETSRSPIIVSVALCFLVHNTVIVVVCVQILSCLYSMFVVVLSLNLWRLIFPIRSKA